MRQCVETFLVVTSEGWAAAVCMERVGPGVLGADPVPRKPPRQRMIQPEMLVVEKVALNKELLK